LAVLSIGRICLKTKGRETGSKCVVVNLIDKNYVEITGPKEVTGVRRRKVNIGHLAPLEKSVKIRKDAPDKMVVTALKRSRLIPFMGGKEIERDEDTPEDEETDSS
jgi:large subunit ribosomal protein L14e